MPKYVDYLSDESDESDSADETDPLQEFERERQRVCNMVDQETHFFSEMSTYPFMWKFRANNIPDIRYWESPVLTPDPIDQFQDVLDEETMRSIQLGIKTPVDYRHFSSETKMHFSRAQLKVIFKFAHAWMQLKGLGNRDFVNELCWVAAKIVFFLTDRKVHFQNNMR
jgi:hypothetical protein